MTAAYLLSLVIVVASHWSDNWLCPATHDEPLRWWCGADEDSIPCQSGHNAHFNVYTNGSVLGTPPINSPSSIITHFGQIITTTFAGSNSKAITVLASSPAKTSTDPSLSTQIQEHSASLPIAIGVGVGIPLGVFGIGLLVLLFWREAARQRRSKSQILSQGTVLRKEHRGVAAAIGGGWSELPDTQLPRELEDTGKRELPST